MPAPTTQQLTGKTIVLLVLGLVFMLPAIHAYGGGDGGAAPVTTLPRVATISPADGATNVQTTSTIFVIFNEAMNSSTVNATTFTVTAGGTPVAGAVTAASGTTYAFTPQGRLAAGTRYTVTVTAGVMDIFGNTMAIAFTSTFTTASAVSKTATIVRSVSPANGATNVRPTSAVSVTFNEAMKPSSIDAATFTVTAGGTPVAGTISSSGTTYTFTPSGILAASTPYTVTVTTGVANTSGEAMAANFTSTFTTGALVPVTVDVSIVDFSFVPGTITVHVGDTVRWTNSGAAPHTSTSGTLPKADGRWSSGILSPRQSFSFTFNEAGEYPYFCQVHAFMTATIIVK
jgi:plastocyanin